MSAHTNKNKSKVRDVVKTQCHVADTCNVQIGLLKCLDTPRRPTPSLSTQLLYRLEFSLRVAFLIIVPACLLSSSYGRQTGDDSLEFFSIFPSVFNYYAVVASAAFLTIREKGCLESIRFLFIVLQGWTLVALSTLLYTVIVGFAPYDYERSLDSAMNVSLATIRTDCSSKIHFLNSVHFWILYFALLAFILCYLLRDERNLRLSLVVFTVTMMGTYKENERMNCRATTGCFVDIPTSVSNFAILGIKIVETFDGNKPLALITFCFSILTEFLCGIILGALATLIPYPLVHPYNSIRSILTEVKKIVMNPRIMCIFNHGRLHRQTLHSQTTPIHVHDIHRIERPSWLRVADSVKVALSLTCSIILYVYLYGNSGWNLPGPAILCFVAVFCDSHIEKLERINIAEDSQPRKKWGKSSLHVRMLQREVLSSLIYGGIQRLVGTLAAAFLGYSTFLFSSNGYFCFGSLVFCIFIFSFFRSYHIELFPDDLKRVAAIISKAGHATGVACFYGCFFLVGILQPSMSSREISVRIAKNFIAVAVYWTISLLYSLYFLGWKKALNFLMIWR